MTKEIKLGDRVKVEFEGTVVGDSAGSFQVEVNGEVVGWFTSDEVTVIPQPIVLPTGKNALIAAGEFVYRLLPSGLWSSANGTERTTDSLISVTKDAGLGFRVIFAGED